MIPDELDVGDALDTFFQHVRLTHPTLLTEYDPQWPSPCELGEPIGGSPSAQGSDKQDYGISDPHQESGHQESGHQESGQQIAWHPVRRSQLARDFDGLENALETQIHSDIKAYYGRYWSANVVAEAPDGHVSLLFLWNQQDVDRLIENLIGHAIACQQNKAPFSVFFALTDDDSELFLSVNNTTGQVQLEKPGHRPVRIVADSLAEFLTYLVPSERSGAS